MPDKNKVESASDFPRPMVSAELSVTLGQPLYLEDSYLSQITSKMTAEQRQKTRMNPRIMEKMRNLQRIRRKNMFVLGILLILTVLIAAGVVLAILAATGTLFEENGRKLYQMGFKVDETNKAFCPAVNCEEIKLRHPDAKNEIYLISVNCTELNGAPRHCCVEVYCDMETFGGGWTVFQKRFNGSVDFSRSCVEYREGFGPLTGEFWAGNNFLYFFTQNTGYELLVEVFESEKHCWLFARYGDFSIVDHQNFSLHFDKFINGTAGDSLLSSERSDKLLHHFRCFSTSDDNKRNTATLKKCAKPSNGGWWYTNCYTSNLNGVYDGGCTDIEDSVIWATARGHYYSFGATEMKLRPMNSVLAKFASGKKFCTDLSFKPCPSDCQYGEWLSWGSCVQRDCKEAGKRKRHRSEDTSTMKPLGMPCSGQGLSVEIGYGCISDRCS